MNATGKNVSSVTRGCTLAGQFHLPGASWHPYLPPMGFDTCAVCTCDVSFSLFLIYHYLSVIVRVNLIN